MKIRFLETRIGSEVAVWAYINEFALEKDLRSYFGSQFKHVEQLKISKDTASRAEAWNHEIYKEWKNHNAATQAFNLGRLKPE